MDPLDAFMAGVQAGLEKEKETPTAPKVPF